MPPLGWWVLWVAIGGPLQNAFDGDESFVRGLTITGIAALAAWPAYLLLRSVIRLAGRSS